MVLSYDQIQIIIPGIKWHELKKFFKKNIVQHKQVLIFLSSRGLPLIKSGTIRTMTSFVNAFLRARPIGRMSIWTNLSSNEHDFFKNDFFKFVICTVPFLKFWYNAHILGIVRVLAYLPKLLNASHVVVSFSSLTNCRFDIGELF